MIKIGSEIGLKHVSSDFSHSHSWCVFCKSPGIQTLKSGLINLYQNKIPIYELISGASIAFAAVLLIIPGFLTDLIGFILLVPFTRKILFKIILRNKTSINEQKSKIDTIDGEIVKRKKMNYKIIGKYIKSLNFNIPNPKTFFAFKDIANYKIILK